MSYELLRSAEQIKELVLADYKLGLATITSDVDVIDQLDIIKSVGFDAFFTGWIPDRTEGIANKAAKLGLIQQSIHSPFSGNYKVSHLWNGGEEGKRVTDSLIECVKDCARFDIPIMVIHPFIGFKDHTPTAVGLDNYARIIEVANKLGVKLGFENVEGEEYLAAIMERFWNEPSLGFCLDTGHEMCYNRHKNMLALYGEKLVHTHFNDNLGVSGEDITFEDDLHFIPTDGIADWHNIMERIKKTGYNGILMSELIMNPSRPKTNPITDGYSKMTIEQFMALAYEKINKAISM